MADVSLVRQRRSAEDSRTLGPSRRNRILFVDDDPLMGTAFKRCVAKAGYDVVLCTSPLEALSCASKSRFGVVVTDLRMPGMDGLTLLEELRELDRETVSILITGIPEVDLPRSPTTDGSLLAVFGKPWDETLLLDAIARAFSLCERRASVNELCAVSLRALLVEDNEADAFLTRRALEKGCAAHVELVSTLRDAELMLDSCEFDVVISDLSLPDGRGIDCIRRLREVAGDAPLIVLTGLHDDAVAGQALESGAQEFLAKGELRPEELQRVITFARHRGRFVSQLSRLASFDALTGLANRRTLRARLAHAQAVAHAEGTHVALLCIDLDRFKTINDTLGHDAGDALLQIVAERLQEVTCEHDTVARLSGDEFAVVLGRLSSPDEAARIVERLHGTMARPVDLSQASVTVSMSIGSVLSTTPRDTLDDLLRAADEAMYVSKRGGRSRRSAMPEQGLERLSLEVELREAARVKAFDIHYQPQFRLYDGALVGFEALLRWQRHDKGTVSPGTFIPLLEDLGLIADVGAWVAREACTALATWRRVTGDSGVRMSVNVSGQQFEHAGLEDVVRDALSRASLQPDDLELEITENLLMRDTSHSRATLMALRKLGVRIAIDDFGTGYSSLAYLKRFRVNTLKIDRSFVSDIDHETSACIASAIITLGQQLGMGVVAEGVETQRQAEYLAQAHGLIVQGYLYGNPGPRLLDLPRGIAAHGKSVRCLA